MVLLYGVFIYTKYMYYLNYIKKAKLQIGLMLVFVFSSTVYTYKILDAESEKYVYRK